jgi:hypothetical protein
MIASKERAVGSLAVAAWLANAQFVAHEGEQALAASAKVLRGQDTFWQT